MYEHDTSSCRKSSQINDSEINILVAILSEEEYFYLLLGNRFSLLTAWLCCFALVVSSVSCESFAFFSNSDSKYSLFCVIPPANCFVVACRKKVYAPHSIIPTSCVTFATRGDLSTLYMWTKEKFEKEEATLSHITEQRKHTHTPKIWRKRIKAIFHLKL